MKLYQSKIAASVFALLLAAGCSESDSDSEPAEDDVVIPGEVTIAVPTTTDEVVIPGGLTPVGTTTDDVVIPGGPTTTDDVVIPGGPTTTDDVVIPVEPTTTGGSTIDPGILRALYGDGAFVFQFSGTAPLFGYLTQFSAQNLIQDADSEDVYLVTEEAIRAFDGVGNGENFMSAGQAVVGCIGIDSTVYYCFATLNDESLLANFLFGQITNGTSQGSFSACDTKVDTGADCARELLQNPDGVVVVAIDSGSSVMAGMDRSTSPIDASPYIRYYEQGTVGATEKSMSASSQVLLDKILKAQDSLLEELGKARQSD